MEQRTGLMGISGKAWGVIGITALAFGALIICALVLMAYGIDVTNVVS